MTIRRRAALTEAVMVILLFAISATIAYSALRGFRNAGVQPAFYQSNFAPAVMVACGRGFISAPSSTAMLDEFLHLTRNDFDCRMLPASFTPLPVTWNATWYYLYSTVGFVWRIAGISWTALDVLASFFGGIVTVALYGLLRFVGARWVAASLSLLLTVSPTNLTYLLSLRDYSKAPFVLSAVLILAVFVIRPMRFAPTLALAALYGALVGFGYGFRSDLTVMVPFGVLVVLLLPPGSLRLHARRNLLAAVLLVAMFLLVGWPALKGLRWGGCQFHYALLGLTTPLTTALRVDPALDRFGAHFLDTFVDLKVGDYAHRMLDSPAPNLCSPAYDQSSGQIFATMATTFPADLAVHAYASTLIILREGIAVPASFLPATPFASSALAMRFYDILNRLSRIVAPTGPILTLAAVAIAWALSARLGLALTLFVLFLTGYPAIEFEERHWFHLRFIPWWAGVFVITQLLAHRETGWTRAALVRGALGVGATVLALGGALAGLRLVQSRTASSLIVQYQAAPTEPLTIEHDDGMMRVAWEPRDYAAAPAHRASDLLVVTLDGAKCLAGERFALRTTYEADVASHDLSTEWPMAPPPVDGGPTQVFIPVFWAGFEKQTYLRFTGFQVVGAPASCIQAVARVTDPKAVPLWIELQVPPDWASRRLYESLRPPLYFGWLFRGLRL